MVSLEVKGLSGAITRRERTAFRAAVLNLLAASGCKGEWTVNYGGRRKGAGRSQALLVGRLERHNLHLAILAGDNGHRYDCWLVLPHDIDVADLRTRLTKALPGVRLASNGRFAH